MFYDKKIDISLRLRTKDNYQIMITMLKKMLVREGLFILYSVVSNIVHFSNRIYIGIVAPLPTKLALISPDNIFFNLVLSFLKDRQRWFRVHVPLILRFL